MKAIFFTLVLAIAANLTASAQDSTSTTTATYNVDDCKKFRSLYYQYLKQKMYKDATVFWTKAWTNCGGTDSLDSKFFKSATKSCQPSVSIMDILSVKNCSSVFAMFLLYSLIDYRFSSFCSSFS